MPFLRSWNIVIPIHTKITKSQEVRIGKATEEAHFELCAPIQHQYQTLSHSSNDTVHSLANEQGTGTSRQDAEEILQCPRTQEIHPRPENISQSIWKLVKIFIHHKNSLNYVFTSQKSPEDAKSP